MTRSATVAALIAALLACSGEKASIPKTGQYVGRLVSPNGSEGSAIVTVGAATDSVTLLRGRAFSRTTGGTTRIVLVLDQPGEMRFTLHGVAAGSRPNFQVIEVADGGDRARPSVVGYAVREVP